MVEQASLTLATKQNERPIEGLLAAPRSDSLSSVLALIEKVALDPRADAEKLEGVMALYERAKAKEAEPRKAKTAAPPKSRETARTREVAPAKMEVKKERAPRKPKVEKKAE